jgi:hypothetical protein
VIQYIDDLENMRDLDCKMRDLEGNGLGDMVLGWATADITPPRPIALIGQLYKRISTGVRDPLTATVLALETRGEGGDKEQAIMISCDLLFTQAVVQRRLQEMIRTQLPDFNSHSYFSTLHTPIRGRGSLTAHSEAFTT